MNQRIEPLYQGEQAPGSAAACPAAWAMPCCHLTACPEPFKHRWAGLCIELSGEWVFHTTRGCSEDAWHLQLARPPEAPGTQVSPSADVVAGKRDGSKEEQDHDDGQCHVLLAEGLPDELWVHTPHSRETHVTPEGERGAIRDMAAGLHLSSPRASYWPAVSSGTRHLTWCNSSPRGPKDGCKLFR